MWLTTSILAVSLPVFGLQACGLSLLFAKLGLQAVRGSWSTHYALRSIAKSTATPGTATGRSPPTPRPATPSSRPTVMPMQVVSLDDPAGQDVGPQRCYLRLRSNIVLYLLVLATRVPARASNWRTHRVLAIRVLGATPPLVKVSCLTSFFEVTFSLQKCVGWTSCLCGP
jgi:hypothetical protein